MKKDTGRYAARGVSAGKEEVHSAVDKLDRGLFPGAFCKITEDYLTGSKTRCNVIHSDGSGTKSIIGYLHFKETGDASVFRGISQDSIVMNIDDLICIGAVERILLSNTVNRNAKNFTGAALAELIGGSEDFLAKLRKLGVKIYSGGGETADVGDLTGAVVVDSCAVAVMKRDSVISGDKIKPGLVIVGLSSSGKASYEDAENSGIGSNGLTSARHDMLSPYYREKYPEMFIILDAKRGDIGNTSAMYARAFFENGSADAVTLSPYMGRDTVEPFLAYEGKWAVILALNSNASAADFEILPLANGRKLYEQVLETASEWGSRNNTMFVVGATQAMMLGGIRKIVPDHFLLVPGVGAQGGSLKDVAAYGMNSHCGLLVNSSRGIIYASSGEDFASAAALKAQAMQQEMDKLLNMYL